MTETESKGKAERGIVMLMLEDGAGSKMTVAGEIMFESESSLPCVHVQTEGDGVEVQEGAGNCHGIPCIGASRRSTKREI